MILRQGDRWQTCKGQNKPPFYSECKKKTLIISYVLKYSDSCSVSHENMVNLLIKKSHHSIKISKFLSVKAAIPLTVNKIASSGVFGPLYTSFPLYGSPLNESFTVPLGYPQSARLQRLGTHVNNVLRSYPGVLNFRFDEHKGTSLRHT